MGFCIVYLCYHSWLSLLFLLLVGLFLEFIFKTCKGPFFWQPIFPLHKQLLLLFCMSLPYLQSLWPQQWIGGREPVQNNRGTTTPLITAENVCLGMGWWTLRYWLTPPTGQWKPPSLSWPAEGWTLLWQTNRSTWALCHQGTRRVWQILRWTCLSLPPSFLKVTRNWDDRCADPIFPEMDPAQYQNIY